MNEDEIVCPQCAKSFPVSRMVQALIEPTGEVISICRGDWRDILARPAGAVLIESAPPSPLTALLPV